LRILGKGSVCSHLRCIRRLAKSEYADSIRKQVETEKEVRKSFSMLYFRNVFSRKSAVCIIVRGGRKKLLFNREIRSGVCRCDLF